MSFKYSFTEHDYDVILRNANTLIPGIDKIVTIYFDAASGNLKSKALISEGESSKIEEFSINDQKEHIAQLRIDKMRFNWLGKSDLIFEIKQSRSSTRDIFGEFENTVLLLKFPNPDDKLADLIFIYFKPNLSNFGLSKSDKSLSTENKSIIASLLYNSFKTFIKINRKNRELFKTINENTKSIIRNAASLKDQLNRTGSYYGESLINLSNQYLKEMGREHGKKYLLTEDATEKIKQFKGNINHLYSIIKNSVIYVDNLFFDDPKQEVRINEWEINMDNYQVHSGNETTATALMEEKYVKTIHLLDKLENAARQVINNNNKLTGSNVGRACPQSISAPAISDSLKKHKNKILVLFDKYPDKWEVIRNRFKPVKNLIVAKNQRFEKSA